MTENPSAHEGSTPPGMLDENDVTIEDNILRDNDTPSSDAPTIEFDEDGNMIVDGIVCEEENVEECVTEQPIDRPSKHSVHEVESQIPFALMVLIILTVLFVIYARVDDWLRFRR